MVSESPPFSFRYPIHLFFFLSFWIRKREKREKKKRKKKKKKKKEVEVEAAGTDQQNEKSEKSGRRTGRDGTGRGNYVTPSARASTTEAQSTTRGPRSTRLTLVPQPEQ